MDKEKIKNLGKESFTKEYIDEIEKKFGIEYLFLNRNLKFQKYRISKKDKFDICLKYGRKIDQNISDQDIDNIIFEVIKELPLEKQSNFYYYDLLSRQQQLLTSQRTSKAAKDERRKQSRRNGA